MKKLLATTISIICCIYYGNVNVNAQSLELPANDTNVYTYMDYSHITDESSK